jgi:hypothetical protein
MEELMAIRSLLMKSSLQEAAMALPMLPQYEELRRTEPNLRSLTSIYRVRSKLAAERGSPWQGWSELVAGLERELVTAPQGSARIYYNLNPEGTKVVLFTDAATTKLLGVLVYSGSRETTGK